MYCAVNAFTPNVINSGVKVCFSYFLWLDADYQSSKINFTIPKLGDVVL